MIKVVDLEGKFFLIDDEYVLSVQASIIISKDEDGYIPNEYCEFVKLLDEDGFEIDEIGLSFNPIYSNKEAFATNTLSIESKSQLHEIKSLQLFDKLVQVKDFNTNKSNSYLVNKFEQKASNSSSKWVPHLAAKIISKSDEISVSVKASLCPQPDQDQYVQDEYIEFVKLLDEEGFQLEEVGISFNNTSSLKLTNSTARTEFYDLSLSNKIKYAQLLDSIICINPTSKNNTASINQPINTSADTSENKFEIYQRNNIRSKGSCNECNAETPIGVNICDVCRAKKLKQIHGITTPQSSETIEKRISRCEKCKCEVPLGAKICDFCRSEQLKQIHSGEKSKSKTTPIAHMQTPKSEWKPWPPQTTALDTPKIKEQPKKIGAIGWIIVIAITFFLINACFG